MTLSSQEMIDQFWADPATGVWTSDELIAVARARLIQDYPPPYRRTTVTIQVHEVGILGTIFCGALDCWQPALGNYYCQRHALDELAREAQSLGLEY